MTTPLSTWIRRIFRTRPHNTRPLQRTRSSFGELLETRTLLSATLSHTGHARHSAPVAAEVREEDRSAPHAKGGTLPNLNGKFLMVTHFPAEEGGDQQSTLDLHQNGKKVTGTIKTDQQPVGQFKAKILITSVPQMMQAQAEPAADPANFVALKGKAQFGSLKSPPKYTKFETKPFNPNDPNADGVWDIPDFTQTKLEFELKPFPP
ncbi:MAG: hypothetical protein U0903_06625 [Planctomycetales bacterium]